MSREQIRHRYSLRSAVLNPYCDLLSTSDSLNGFEGFEYNNASAAGMLTEASTLVSQLVANMTLD